MKIKHVVGSKEISLPSLFGIFRVTTIVNKIRNAVIGGIEAKKSLQCVSDGPLFTFGSRATSRDLYLGRCSSPLLTSTHLVLITNFVLRPGDWLPDTHCLNNLALFTSRCLDHLSVPGLSRNVIIIPRYSRINVKLLLTNG